MTHRLLILILERCTVQVCSCNYYSTIMTPPFLLPSSHISQSQRHQSSVCWAGSKTSSPICQSTTSGMTGTLGKHWGRWWTAARQVTCAGLEPVCDGCGREVLFAQCVCHPDVGRTVSGLGDLGPAEKGGERLRSHAAGRRLAGHPAGWCLLHPD